MESFQQIRTRFLERFREISVFGRVSVIGLSILALAGVLYLAGSHTDGTRVDLLAGKAVTARQLHDIEKAFRENELNDYQISGRRVLVPKVDEQNYLDALDEALVFSGSDAEDTPAASIFDDRRQRDARIKRAHQNELARTIAQMKGINKATVNYDAKEVGGLRKQKVFTASVTVHPSHDRPLPESQKEEIQEFLAHSIAGLEPENIYILDLNSSPAPESGFASAPYHDHAHAATPLHGDMRAVAAESSPSRTQHGTQDTPQDATPQQSTLQQSTQWTSSPASLVVLGLVFAVGLIALRHIQKPATDKSINTDRPEQERLINPTAGDPIHSDDPNHAVEFEASADIRQDPFRAASAGVRKPQGRLTMSGDFSHKRLIPRHQADGIELNDLTSSLLFLPTATAASSTPPAEETIARFQFVNESTPEDLVQLLIHENSQIIAIVFSHLDAEQAGAVLKRLPEPLQLDVLRRLSDLDDLTDKVVREIERGLETRLAAQLRRTEKRNAGIQAVNDLLGTIDTASRTSILDGLANGSRELAERLQARPPAPTRTASRQAATPDQRAGGRRHRLTFSDVASLAGEDLCRVLSAANSRDAVLALSEVEREVVDRVANKMKPREANRLRQAIKELGPVRPGDVAASQQVVAKLASQMRRAGRIRLNSQSATSVPA